MSRRRSRPCPGCRARYDGGGRGPGVVRAEGDRTGLTRALWRCRQCGWSLWLGTGLTPWGARLTR